MKKIIFIFLLLLFPFIFLNFRSSNFYLTHDGPFHMERTYNFVESIREGNFPPSWTKNYNSRFGSPVFIFLFPIPYFVSSFFYSLGINLVSTLKISFIFFQFVMLLSMYLFLRRGMKLSKYASILGSAVYLYSPYNLAQVFVRGSLREFAGSAIFPLVLWALTRLKNKPNKKNVALSSLILAIFLLTDGLSVALFFLLLTSYILYLLFTSQSTKKFLKYFVITFILGFSISAYIYLPFIFEYKYLKPITTNIFQDHFVYFWQFFDYHWGFGFSNPGPSDTFSMQIGIINILSILLFIFLILNKKIKKSSLSFIFVLQLPLYIFLMTQSPLIFTVWEKLPYLKIIQLPWRFLSVVVFICSIIAAYLANHFKIGNKLFIAFCILIFIISFKYLRTNQITVYDPSYIPNNSGDATNSHEFIPKWRESTSGFEGFNKITFTQGSGNIDNLNIKNSQITFTTLSSTSTKVRISTLYFPGWKSFIDGKETALAITENKNKSADEKRDVSGLMEIEIPKGEHNINFYFTDTLIRKIGKIISITGLLITFLILLKAKFHRNP